MTYKKKEALQNSKNLGSTTQISLQLRVDRTKQRKQGTEDDLLVVMCLAAAHAVQATLTEEKDVYACVRHSKKNRACTNSPRKKAAFSN